MKVRSYYHRVWRAVAARMSHEQRRDWLPGYPWLVVFVHQWINAAPEHREAVASWLVDENSHYRRAIVRAGGPHEAFKLVLGDQSIPATWTLPDRACTREDVANTLVMILSTMGVRL